MPPRQRLELPRRAASTATTAVRVSPDQQRLALRAGMCIVAVLLLLVLLVVLLLLLVLLLKWTMVPQRLMVVAVQFLPSAPTRTPLSTVVVIVIVIVIVISTHFFWLRQRTNE